MFLNFICLVPEACCLCCQQFSCLFLTYIWELRYLQNEFDKRCFLDISAFKIGQKWFCIQNYQCVSVFRRHWYHGIWSLRCNEIISNLKWTDLFAISKMGNFGSLIGNTYFGFMRVPFGTVGSNDLKARKHFWKCNFFEVGLQ